MGKAQVNGVNGHVHRPLSPYETMIRGPQRPPRRGPAAHPHPRRHQVGRRHRARLLREGLPRIAAGHARLLPLPPPPLRRRGRSSPSSTAIERDIRRQLGEFNAPGQIMARMCQEYREVVHLLTHRGTPVFAEISERLYGCVVGQLPRRRPQPGRSRPHDVRHPRQPVARGHLRPRGGDARRRPGRRDAVGPDEGVLRRRGGGARAAVGRHRRRRRGRQRLHQDPQQRPLHAARGTAAGGPRGLGPPGHDAQRPGPAGLHLPEQGAAVLDDHAGGAGGHHAKSSPSPRTPAGCGG